MIGTNKIIRKVIKIKNQNNLSALVITEMKVRVINKNQKNLLSQNLRKISKKNQTTKMKKMIT